MGPRFVHTSHDVGGARLTSEKPVVDVSSGATGRSAALEAALALAVPAAVEPTALHVFVAEAVGKALARRGVPTSELKAPDKRIYLPAIDTLRYSQMTDEIIHLIASSMDARIGHRVLPSYLEVIKQMSRDELEIVRCLPRLGRSSPITHVNLVLPTQQAIVVYRNVLPEPLAAVCEFKDNIPQYIDNLSRLGVIDYRSEDQAGTTTYRAMARLSFVKRMLTGAPQGSRIAMSPSAIALTDFGDGLRRACLE